MGREGGISPVLCPYLSALTVAVAAFPRTKVEELQRPLKAFCTQTEIGSMCWLLPNEEKLPQPGKDSIREPGKLFDGRLAGGQPHKQAQECFVDAEQCCVHAHTHTLHVAQIGVEESVHSGNISSLFHISLLAPSSTQQGTDYIRIATESHCVGLSFPWTVAGNRQIGTK